MVDGASKGVSTDAAARPTDELEQHEFNPAFKHVRLIISLLAVVPTICVPYLLLRPSLHARNAKHSAEFDSPLKSAVHDDRARGYVPFWVRDERCLDGSPAGGYWRPVAGSDVTVVFLQGGGFCDDAASCAARAADASATSLGGSRGWRGDTCPRSLCAGVMATDCAENPDFCNATLVYLRYCSGDHWLGRRNAPVVAPAAAPDGAPPPSRDAAGGASGNDETTTAPPVFYFSGQRILDAALDRHLAPLGLLRDGARLLLAGRSMGGIGVAARVDAVAARYPGVDVRGLVGWALEVVP